MRPLPVASDFSVDSLPAAPFIVDVAEVDVADCVGEFLAQRLTGGLLPYFARKRRCHSGSGLGGLSAGWVLSKTGVIRFIS